VSVDPNASKLALEHLHRGASRASR
jgi:hypothetical protein